MKFLGKAHTLLQLQDQLVNAVILPLFCIKYEIWATEKTKILSQLFKEIQTPLYIVRSTSKAEDSEQASLAGHFLTISNVRSNSQELSLAIDKVFESYGNPCADDEVFIQKMLSHMTMSGVAFSGEPNCHAPYWVINYDENSKNTDSVTSGQSNQLKTLYLHYSHINTLPLKFCGLNKLIIELAVNFNNQTLDIEFAVSQNVLYLLQVRPLICEEISSESHTKTLFEIQEKIENLNQRHPYLYGEKTVFGIMPDWNPAEIIGVRPRPLALSLYQELVTNKTWAYQRDNYGYKNLRSFPLMHSFSGCPYIDVRVSFNSFLPADLDPDLSERLINYYIDRLKQSPSLHDKVEFEVIFSCYTLDLLNRLNTLKEFGFNKTDIYNLDSSLRNLTNRVIHSENGLWLKDIHKIGVLESRWKSIKDAKLEPLAKIYWLIEDCKRYGTLPFAGLARAGFIAIQMLKSLVKTSIITEHEYQTFMLSLNTVSSQIHKDQASLSRKTFLKKYGHLRPGTYDILSSRYDEAPDQYFDKWPTQTKSEHPKFTLSQDQFKALRLMLKQHKLDLDETTLFDFIKEAIEGREFAKFVFTRHLSDVLTLIETLGIENQLSREDCSFLKIQDILALYTQSTTPKKAFIESINTGKKAYEMTKKIILPPLITKPSDIWHFELNEGEPNFITLNRTTSDVLCLKKTQSTLEGKILMVKSADPGYDWIFSHKIAGLITEFGGVNSHMAIRACELGIPAVIGAGEVLFNKWSKAKTLDLDCENKSVKILL